MHELRQDEDSSYHWRLDFGDFAAEVMEQVKAAQKTDKTDPPTKH